jgi:uncharacterized protein YbjT (DUF2867 family)
MSAAKKELDMLDTKRTYLVTCATGNVGDRAARQLLAKGHGVRVLGRDPDRLQPLVDLGATPFVGDMRDAARVTAAFDGVDAALLICKGDIGARDYRRDFARAGEAYAEAARATRLKSAIFISSLGAHDDRHRGLVVIHGDVEQALNAVPGLDLINLRAPMFFEDLFYYLHPMRALGMLAWPIAPDSPIDMGSSRDVADIAVARLEALDFAGKQAIELHGQPGLTTRRIADAIAAAIGRPMPVRPASREDDIAGMIAAGMGRDFAILMNQAWDTFSHGLIREEGLAGSVVLPQPIDEFIVHALAPAILASG